MNSKIPNWYHQMIDENIQGLIHLLRDNGWNTVSSCGHAYEGVIIIDCYAGQSGSMLGGGLLLCLRDFLRDNGYEHFEITRKMWQWHGHMAEDVLIIKLLNSDWHDRWK